MKYVNLIFLSLLYLIPSNAQVSSPYLKGMANLSLKNYDSAIKSFSIAILNNPDKIDCYLNRGIAYYYTHKLVKAENDFKYALDNEETDALVWIAKVQASNNNPVLCAQYLKEYIKLSTNLNASQVLKDDDFQAIHYSKSWQDLVSMDYENELDKSLNEANYFQKKGRYTDGISVLNNALLNFGEIAEIYFIRAKLYLASENTTLALSDIYHAVELDANNIIYIEFLADIYSLNLNFDKAVANYKEVIEIRPENFSAYKKLAKAELENNMFENAKKTLSSYIQYFNSDTSAIFLFADIYFRLGEYQNSLRNLNELIENYQAHASWFLKRGLCFEETGTLKYAAADLSMCLDLEPNNPKANLHLGNVQQKLGNKESACFYWERALRAGELNATEYILENCQ